MTSTALVRLGSKGWLKRETDRLVDSMLESEFIGEGNSLDFLMQLLINFDRINRTAKMNRIVFLLESKIVELMPNETPLKITSTKLHR